MSAELIAIIAAAVTLGGLVTAQIASVRARIDTRINALGAAVDARLAAIDARLRAVETELAYLLRGLLQGFGIPPTHRSDDEESAA